MAVYQIIPGGGKFTAFLKEHSADILTYSGIVLMGGSTVAAAIGTKHMLEEKEEIDKESELVKRVWARSKHYVAAVGLFGAGTFCVLKSDGLMKAKNELLKSEVLALTAGSLAYRQRWKDKVGDEEEKKVFLDEKTEEVVDENGKKKKVKTTNIDRRISTERYFDRWSSWRADDHGDTDLDIRTIRNVQAMLCNELCGSPERMVLLNHVYDMLGLYMINKHGQRVADQSVAGQVAGWIWDKDNPTGDNTIVINVTRTTRRLDDGRVVPTLLLEFNVDGNIMEAAQERGLLG